MGKHNIVLITGGLGYIGAPTAYALSRMGFRVVVFDSARFCQSIPGIKEVPNPGIGKKENYIFVQGDIRDISALTLVMKKYQPGIVIHFAALTSATESEKQKALYVDTNVRGTKNVLGAMKTSGCNNLIFASSASVYGLVNNGLSEDSVVHPMHTYASTKKEAEQIIQEEAAIRWVILRYFNVVGATKDGLFGEPIRKNPKLIPSALRVGLGLQKKLPIYGNDYPTPDGTAIRDYISLEDVVRSNIDAVRFMQKDNPSNIFNIGIGVGTSNLEAVHVVEKKLGKKIPILLKNKRKEAIISVANIKKAKKMLGWKPQCSSLPKIIDGLVSFQKNFINNRNSVRI